MAGSLPLLLATLLLAVRCSDANEDLRWSASRRCCRSLVLRLFISLKYVIASEVDRKSCRIVVTTSSAEKPIKGGLDCGRTCNSEAASASVGEMLAFRLKVDG